MQTATVAVAIQAGQHQRRGHTGRQLDVSGEEDGTITVSIDAPVVSTLEATALTRSQTLDPDGADAVARIEVAVVHATP
jgi:hypothetical protein